MMKKVFSILVLTAGLLASATLQAQTTYDLKIAGVDVTSANCSDLSVISGVTGTVKYDPVANTLILKDATINATKKDVHGVYCTQKINILVEGTVNIKSERAAVFITDTTGVSTIGGSGTLNLEGWNGLEGRLLHIENITLKAKGTYAGITGSSKYGRSTLTIDKASITAEGNRGGSIINVVYLTLNNCSITQPAGAAFDAGLKAVAQGGQIVKSKVVISQNPTDIAEASAEQALTLYPNPVADVLYLSATARTIRVYDMYGTEVAHATDTDRVEVSHLPAGVYTVRADGTVAKMVKR